MKKLLLAIVALVASLSIEAKIIKITLADGSVKVYTSSQLSAIDFNDDGTLTLTTYDGQELPPIEADYDAVEITDEETIFDSYDRELEFGYEEIVLYKRGVHQLNFVYPTTDPFGQPISLSGTMLIPDLIWSRIMPCEGTILVNHFTVFNRDECPSRGYAQFEGFLLANPLNPNYIIVESDYYGFGVTERFPQAYIQGTVNARANLDCLLAARRLLANMGLDYGSLSFNVGYSSGGFEALATQKLRDMEYKDQITFNKTFAGGSPSDLDECYRLYVINDSTAYNCVPLELMVATNYTQQLGLNDYDVLQPEIAAHIDDWIHSKKYSSWDINDLVGREKKVHEILTAPYCDLESQECKDILKIFKELSIRTGWVPDPTQRIFLMHSRDDDYVPVQSARGILSFLEENGFTPSIIPGRTNLQTNFVVKKLGHVICMVVPFAVQTIASISAWPIMYSDNQLLPTYEWLLNQDLPTLVDVLRYLDGRGIDSRALINQLIQKLTNGTGSGQIDYATLIVTVDGLLAKVGLSIQEVMEMLKDSGFDPQAIFAELQEYINEGLADGKTPHEVEVRLRQAVQEPQTPAEQYEQQVNEWLEQYGILK